MILTKILTYLDLFSESFKFIPKTRVITAVSAGATILDVDSTVGFGTNGTLVINSSTGTATQVTYFKNIKSVLWLCKRS